MWKCICMAVALWGCTGVLQAKVVLPSVFTDNMVLQQKTDITFYGDATKNKQLTVKTGWNGKEYHTEADGQGKWSLKIPTPGSRRTLRDHLLRRQETATEKCNDRRSMVLLRTIQHGNAGSRLGKGNEL